MDKKINYSARDFVSVRSELFSFIQQYYPDLVNDFNDSSIGSMLVELNAAVASGLYFNLDRTFQETQRDSVQERKNILAMARTFGYNIPHKKSSITIVDFSVDVPPYGDSYDKEYLPIIKAGSQVLGGSFIFENIDDIDFSSKFGSNGNPNLTVIPNIDSSDVIKSYTITKRELVVQGITKIFKKVVTPDENKPFLELILPDSDVVSVEQVIVLDGTNYISNPANDEFYNQRNRFFEVESLAEAELFLENKNVPIDPKGLKTGKFIKVSKRFIKEFTDNGFCKLTFGGGSSNADVFENLTKQLNLTVPSAINYLNNNSLGEIPKSNSTMFVKYRVGGGASSNIGSNVLTQLGNVIINVNGSRADYNSQVKGSLKVNNPIPALGGADAPSVEQIRRLISYNNASQNRCVTLKDYVAQITKMPAKFGAPFRSTVYEEQNKIVISILGLDANNHLDNSSTTTLKQNISEYLSDYRMINDFVEVKDGKIINLAFDFDLIIDKAFNRTEVVSSAIIAVLDFLNIQNQDMNQNIYMGNLIEIINNVAGVINVSNVAVFNKVDGDYSSNRISQAYKDEATKEIELIDYTIFGEIDGMFEIKNNKDIKIRVKSI